MESDSKACSLDFRQSIYSNAFSALRLSTALEENKSVSCIDGAAVKRSEVESVLVSLQWGRYFERIFCVIQSR